MSIPSGLTSCTLCQPTTMATTSFNNVFNVCRVCTASDDGSLCRKCKKAIWHEIHSHDAKNKPSKRRQRVEYKAPQVPMRCKEQGRLTFSQLCTATDAKVMVTRAGMVIGSELLALNQLQCKNPEPLTNNLVHMLQYNTELRVRLGEAYNDDECPTMELKLLNQALGIQYGVLATVINEMKLDDKQWFLTRVATLRTMTSLNNKLINELKIETVPVIALPCQRQMDSLVAAAAPIVTSIGGALIKEGLEKVGKSARESFGSNFDSPAVLRAIPEQNALCDIPCEATSVGFKSGDITGNACSVVSADPSIDPADLLKRCSIESWLSRLTWTKSFVPGFDLFDFNLEGGTSPMYVSPAAYFSRNVLTGFNAYGMTMPGCIGLMYSRWRGSLVYTIEVVCTRFHQGQLYVAYQPFDGATTTRPTLSQARNCIGATIDLKITNRTTLTVPYNALYDYLSLPDTPLVSLASPAYSMGNLMIYVQNPLTGPDTVADNIEVNVWIKVGDDFEFISPQNPKVVIPINGSFQSGGFQSFYSEILADDRLSVPAVHIPTGVTGDNMEQVSVDCNVTPADLTTVMEREYLLATGITWTPSLVRGTHIAVFDIGLLFGQQPLALSGLLDYHNYFRGDFEFTLRLNSNPFMSGMIGMWSLPAGLTAAQYGLGLTNFMFPTMKQMGLAQYTPQSDTTVTLRVPWTNHKRLVTTEVFKQLTSELGSLYVTVMNPLKVGTGSSTITGTLWGRVINPYVGFKRANLALTHSAHILDMSAHITTQAGEVSSGDVKTDENPDDGDPPPKSGMMSQAPATSDSNGDVASSDTALGRSKVARLVPMVRKPKHGYLRTSHMNAYELLRRPDFLTSVHRSTTGVNETLNALFGVGTVGTGKAHSLVRSLYRLWNGSFRYRLHSDCPQSQGCLAFANWETTVNSWAVVTGSQPMDKSTLYEGSVIFKPFLETGMVVTVPYYAAAPLQYCPAQYTQPPADESLNGYLTVGGMSSVTNDFTFQVFQSIGDDFRLYHPMPCPEIRVLTTTVAQGAWVRDLTTEGVEPNPGPDTIDYDDVDAAIQDMINAATEQGIVKGVVSFFARIWKIISGQYHETVAERVKEQLGKIHSAIMDKILPVIVWGLDFLCNIYVVMNSWDPNTKLIAMTSLATKCVIAYAHGSELLEQLTEVIKQCTQQMEMKTMTMLAGTIATVLVAGAMTLLGVGIIKSDVKNVRELAIWKAAEACMMMSKINSGVKAAPELWNVAKTGIQTGLSFLIEGENLYSDWYTQNKDRLERWQNDYDHASIKGWFDNNNCLGFSEGKSNFVRLTEFAYMAKQVRVYSPSVKGFPVVINRTAEKVLNDMTRVQKAYDYANGRVEPVGMWIEGFAGCGKSFAWTRFVPFLVLSELGMAREIEDVKRQVYSKPCDPNQQFMDGYASQAWVMCDDFASGVEDQDALQMINLISVASCAVNMADLSEKKTVFDSKFICATTNQRSTDVIVSVRDKSALIRRFPFAYHQGISPAFEAGDKLNMEKLAKSLDGVTDRKTMLDILDTVWIFKKLNLQTGSMEEKPTLLSQIVKDIIAEYSKRKRLDGGIDKILAGIHQGPDGAEGPLKFVPLVDIDTPLSCLANLRAIPDYDEEVRLGAKFVEANYTFGENINRDMMRTFADQVRDLVRDDCLDYESAQRVLVSIRGAFKDLGYMSFDELSSTAYSSRPCSRSELFEWRFNTAAEFESLVKMLGSFQKPDGYVGPKRMRWRGLVPYLSTFFKVAGSALLIYAGVKLAKVLLTKAFVEQGPQYDHGGRREPMRGRGKGKASIQRVMASPQGGEELSDVQKSLFKAIRGIRYQATGGTYGLSCMALDNRTLLVPYHFYQEYRALNDTSVKVEVEKKSRTGELVGFQPIRMDALNVCQLEETGSFAGSRDLVVVKLVGNTIQHARDIRSLVATRAMKNNWFRSTLMCFLLEPQQNHMRASVGFDMQISFGKCVGLPGVTAIPTLNGDCGRPYVVMNRTVHRPLIGMHVWKVLGTRAQVGIADFSLDCIEEAEAIIAKTLDVPVTVPELCLEEMSVTIRGGDCPYWTSDMERFGKADWNGVPIARYQPSNTMFERSPVSHKNWEDSYGPTTKKPITVGGQILHPLYSNAQKFCDNLDLPMPSSIHQTAVSFMKKKIGVLVDNSALSLDEMINGDEGINPLVLSTSCGYYQKHFSNGKKELFEALPQVEGEKIKYVLSDKAKTVMLDNNMSFEDLLREQEKRLTKGEAPVTIWVATNKDELVSLEKQRIGKTRVFVQPTLDITLLVRKYFGRFLQNYKSRAGFNLCHGIGQDKESCWGAYLAEFMTVGDKGFDVDYSNYDGSVPQCAVDAVLVVLDHAYGGRFSKERAALMSTIVQSYIVVGDQLVQKRIGNCSGSPITDVLNSLTNWYHVLCAYQIAQCMNGQKPDLDQFDLDVRALTYGDDLLVSARDDVLEWFNRCTFAQYAEVLGMKVTAANKGSELLPSEFFADLTFLKSPFIPRGRYVAAPLPKKVIYRELMWQKKVNAGDTMIFDQKIEMALLMMAHHGRKATDQLLQELEEAGVKREFDFGKWEREMIDKQEFYRVDVVSRKDALDEYLCSVEVEMDDPFIGLDGDFMEEG